MVLRDMQAEAGMQAEHSCEIREREGESMSDAYEKFVKDVENMTIDQTPTLNCPKCGGSLNFHGMPEETYMRDGMFIRNELLWCDGCNLNIEVEQVYAPTRCYVTEFNDVFCEEEE